MAQQDDRAATTAVEARGERELIVMRIFAAPPALVFRAWSEADLFRRWWMPQSVVGVELVGCAMDVRTGGTYRLEFAVGGGEAVAFHGRYLEVVPGAKIVWTNDEGEDGAVTTVTFADHGGGTLLTFHELYPTQEARDEALQGGAAALPEQLDQLGDVLASRGG
ncbi:SRPBCC domain-containing protein [Novosphingobium sp.]|uniref:SRPBCC domain-containing protein n=1 Tax=Novosphingobium sp. TaxID=1874826 RepID=UPI0038BAEF6E